MKSKVREKIIIEPKPQHSALLPVIRGKAEKLISYDKKKQWENQQNTFKRIYSEETGTTRLVKGTREIVEECVSRERHLAIDKQATRGDVKMKKFDIVEEFYGVYLLKCLNPKFKEWTYIGFTVDPNRRIKQHNRGKLYGGAWRTSQKGPWWEMTLTVHGFPSEISALRFEWAWQHPTKSRRMKAFVRRKKASETSFDYFLKVMFEMLRIPPWCRLPLTVRWLSADVMIDPPPNLSPPMHMPIVYGPVASKKLKSPKNESKSEGFPSSLHEEELNICKLCQDFVFKKDCLMCLVNECQAQWHVICLAQHFLKKESLFIMPQTASSMLNNILPVEGNCPECDSMLLWGDLVRKKKGCYGQLEKVKDK